MLWTKSDAKRHPHLIFAEIVCISESCGWMYAVVLHTKGQVFKGDRRYARHSDALKTARKITPRVIDQSVYS